MSGRMTHLWLQDIAEAIQHVLDFTSEFDYDAFSKNIQTKHAVFHNFTVIGEAASKIPSEYKNLHPEVAWREIKSFRNYVVHEYFGLDDRIVWNIIQADLTRLLGLFKTLLEKENRK